MRTTRKSPRTNSLHRGERPQPQSDTLAHALKLLKARDRFESELRGLLAAASSPSSEIDEAISALKSLGFLDDARHASAIAARLSRTKLWARRRIVADLRHRGASRGDAATACESLPEDRETAALFVRKCKCQGAALARRLAAAGYDHALIEHLCDLEA